jgi:SAM-dependent methyltransferase
MAHTHRHLRIIDPEPWVERFTPLITDQGQVLDLACGGGRHSTFLLDQGLRVTAIDLHTDIITERLGVHENLSIITADMEGDTDIFGARGALTDRRFDGIIGVNYLHRELFQGLVNALEPGGVFIYETFASGNELYTRPRNPDHLLNSGELLDVVSGQLKIIAYEHGVVNSYTGPGVRQRIAAIKSDAPQKLEDVDLNDYEAS